MKRILLSILCILLGTAPLIGVINTLEAGQSMLQRGFGKDSLLVKISWEGAGIDVAALKDLESQMPELKSATPAVELSSNLSSFRGSSPVKLKAVGSDYGKLGALDMQKGRFISPKQMEVHMNVIVLDDLTADALFGTTDVIGRSLQVQSAGTDFEVKVIGVCKRMDVYDEKLDKDTGIAFIPVSLLQYQTGQAQINDILFAVEGLQQEEAEAKLLHFLQGRGAGVTEDHIKILTQLTFLGSLSEKYSTPFFIMAVLWFLGAFVALIYIFLLDVEQNKKYIGLLLFYGNPQGLVKGIIYDKAFLISVISSAVSAVLGLGASFAATKVLNLPFGISIHSITAAIVIPAVLSAASVVYPASRAVKQELGPIIWQTD